MIDTKEASMMKRLAVRALDKLGYALIPKWRLANYPVARYLRRLFADLHIDCVLDVGANRGQYRDFLRQHCGYRGRIVSFEPIPELYRVLCARALHDEAWVVHPHALGARRSREKFKIMASSEFSSLLAPTQASVTGFEQMNRVVQEIDVDVLTLDECFSDLTAGADLSGVFLKLDTQGCDLEVMRGASGSLTRIAALSTEASVMPLYVGMPDLAETIAFLQRAGFVPSGIFPNNEGHFPLLIEFDLYAISAESATKFSSTRFRPTATPA